VSRIEQGKPSDLNGKRLPTSAKGMVPWYIHEAFSFTGADYQGSPPSFLGTFADDSSATSLIRSENIGPCPSVANFKLNKQQRTATACEVVLAPPGARVVGALTYLTNDAHKSFQGTWK
jgi:hypothetical protein